MDRATVRLILANEIYTGTIYYGKTRLGPKEYETQPKWKREQPVARDEWIKVDLPELAIIDQHTFDAAQERAKRNKDMARRNRRGHYLMSGFLRCGDCNHAMTGMVFKKCRKDGSVHERFVYYCGNRKCPAYHKWTVTHTIDDPVWEWLKEEVQDGNKLVKGLKELAQEREGELTHKRERLATLDDSIVEEKRRIARLAKEISYTRDEDITAALRKQMNESAQLRDDYLRDKDKLTTELTRRELSQERQNWIISMAQGISRRMEGNPTTKQRRDLFEALEVQVVLYRLDDKLPIDMAWAIGQKTRRYLGETATTDPPVALSLPREKATDLAGWRLFSVHMAGETCGMSPAFFGSLGFAVTLCAPLVGANLCAVGPWADT